MEVGKVKKHRMFLLLILTSFLFLSSCGSKSDVTPQSQTVTVYATPSAQPWLSDLFACAADLSIVMTISAEAPDITLRIGEPDDLLSPSYQIGEEELLIVTHRESPVQNLSLEEAQALFSGSGGESVQVWVYPSELDVQGLFDQFVMQGRSVTSSAKVAINPQQMSDLLNSNSNAVGLLPKHWKAGNVREVYSVGTFPVLAVTREEPLGAVQNLISCLQK